jgi:hypothetical protein
MKRITVVGVLLLALTGCADRYRYSCQDPAIAQTIECQCDQQPRTKNKALDGLMAVETTTTLPRMKGYDC